jgi:electron transport complex protein RnfG
MADVPVIKSGVTLTALAALCTALVAFTHEMTDERIADNERAWLEQSLQPVLGGVEFDSNLIESRLTIEAPHDLPGSDDAVVYRVFSGDVPVAALLAVTARDGYSGAIRLLIGVRTDGTITAVHALSHRETPGLGDGIDRSKSDWIEQFSGRSLADPASGGWRIARDGGDFDQMTGASVTSRAVVGAVSETLQYFASNNPGIFALPVDRREVGEQ